MWRCPSCGEQLPDGIEACWLCGTAPDGTADPDFAAEEMPERRPRPAAAPDLPVPAPDKARQLWIEVLVVVAVAVLPDVWWAIADPLFWDLPQLHSAGMSISVLVRSTTVSAVVLYLLWRSGDPWRSFGLSRPRAWDLVVGFLVALAVGIAHLVVVTFLWQPLPAAWQESLGSDFAFATPQSAVDWVLEVAAQLANGFAEELAMRAYLLLRLRQLLGSTASALLLSSALFASYHVYQGPWGCVSSFVYGVLMGLVFLRIRRLWPIALAHAISNLNITVSSALS